MSKYYKIRIILIFIPYVNILSGVLFTISLFRWSKHFSFKQKVLIGGIGFGPALLPIQDLFLTLLGLCGVPTSLISFISQYSFMVILGIWWFLVENHVRRNILKY